MDCWSANGWLKLSFASFQKETKKKSVTAGLYEDPDRLVVVKKRGCDWVRVGDRGDTTLPPR